MRNPFLKFIGLEFRTIGIATSDLISTVVTYPFVILGAVLGILTAAVSAIGTSHTGVKVVPTRSEGTDKREPR